MNKILQQSTPYTETESSKSAPKIKVYTSGIAMVSMLTMAIPENGL